MSVKRIMESVIIDYDDEEEEVAFSTDYGDETQTISVPFIQLEKVYEAILSLRGKK